MQSQSPTRRSRVPGAEALSVASLLCTAGTLAAQSATPTPSVPPTQKGEKPTKMDEVIVEANANVYNVQRLQSPKYTEPLRDTPQTITVIPKAVIQERAAFSLRDVLKNTPGVSMQAGEGISAAGTGDNPSIRGFNSRSDFFIDNMRDLGGYNRDPFNLEQVEVAKGPASTITGRGTTGGSINLVTKMASLDPYNLSNFSYGSDNLYRGTVDVNEPLGEHAALRLNGLYHSNDTPGRNDVTNERYGIAASLGLGLGTDTRVTLNYQRLEENNVPDFGIPWVPAGNFQGSGAALNGYANQIAPVDYDTFYGRRNYDYQKNQADIITLILEHDFSKSFRIRNTSRYYRVHADARVTAPRFRDINNLGGNQYNFTIVREEHRRDTTNEYFANQTLAMADFDTGALKHSLVAGLEFYWERQTSAIRAGNSTVTSLINPSVSNPLPPLGGANPDVPGAIFPVASPAPNRDNPVQGVGVSDLPGPAESHVDTISIFLFDTVKFGKQWELAAGIRYDHIDAEQRGSYYTGVNDVFGTSTAVISNREDLFSWKSALIYKPVDIGSIYFGYGTSFNPAIDSGVSGNLGLATQGNPSTQGLDAEETQSYELGTKWDLFKERLSLTAALFRTQKTNARTTIGGVTSLAGDQLVEGFELGLAGQITRNWQAFAGYAHMASETRASSNTPEIGQSLPNAPDHTFNLWTTYNVTRKLQIGAGAQYMSDVIGNQTNPTRVVPEYWLADAMVIYQFTPKFGLRLNVNNLTNKRYIESSSSTGHVIPGAGRSITLTASVKF